MTEFEDDVLGTLRWDEKSEAWAGEVEFLPGTKTPLTVEFDFCNPSDEEKLTAIGTAKETYKALDAQREISLRREAARTVVIAAYSQSEVVPPIEEVEQLFQEMSLSTISLWSWEEGTGYFFYKTMSGRIQVVFKQEMAVDEVMCYD